MMLLLLLLLLQSEEGNVQLTTLGVMTQQESSSS